MEQRHGPSGYYIGDSGLSYFRWQSLDGVLSGQIDAAKFQRFIGPNDTVLDLGCGGGYLLSSLRCGSRIGVEPNPHARRAALANGVECRPSLDEVPFEAADVGISNHALEHIANPIEALREFKAKIKHGGTLILCVPIDDWRTWRHYNPKDINRHLQTWNPQLLGNTLSEAGLEASPNDINILTHCWPPRFPGFFYRTLPRKAFNALCTICAWVLRRRQLLAVVTVLHVKPPE